MDGATFVLLIPFLRTLFGQQAIPVGGGSSVERVLAAVAGPLLAAGSPEGALRNVVAGVVGTLGLKKAPPVAPARLGLPVPGGGAPRPRPPPVRPPPGAPPGLFSLPP